MARTYDALVLRPRPGNLTRRQRLVLWSLLAVPTLLIAAGLAVAAGPLGFLIAVAIPGVPVLLGWGSSRCSRIVVTPHEIAVLGLIFRRRRQRARAVRIVRARIVQPRGPVSDTVFVLDAAGRTVIRIGGGHNYHRVDIDRLVGFLGLPWSGPDEPVTPNRLSTTHPGLVRRYEAHPFLLGMVGAACAVVFAVVVTVLIAVLSP